MCFTYNPYDVEAIKKRMAEAVQEVVNKAYHGSELAMIAKRHVIISVASAGPSAYFSENGIFHFAISIRLNIKFLMVNGSGFPSDACHH